MFKLHSNLKLGNVFWLYNMMLFSDAASATQAGLGAEPRAAPALGAGAQDPKTDVYSRAAWPLAANVQSP